MGTKSKSTKTVVMPSSVIVKGEKIKLVNKVADMTNRTNSNLWVTFVANKSKDGILLGTKLTRDEARNAGSKFFGTGIQNVRSQRVSTYRRRTAK